MYKYKTIDLCAGIGGIRRGFELTGKAENVLSAENDKYACRTYEHLFNDNPMHDITTDEFKDLIKNTPYDILLAGFPCQAFSAVGKREGFKDITRGTIFFHIAEMIESSRPKAFLLENVEGLLTHDKGRTFEVILDTLINQLDYHIIGIQPNLVNDGFYFERSDLLRNARDFGLPQNRPRVYIVVFDKRRYEEKLKKLKFKSLPKRRKREPIFNDLNDVLVMGEDKSYYLAQGYVDTLKRHKSKQGKKGNGFGYQVVNAEGIEHPISNAILATGGSGKERNLVYDPQEGIAGQVVKNKKTPLNDEGIRLMTPNEWAKLQGFLGYAFIQDGEEKFSFPEDVSNTQRYKQLGNSVAIPVIEEIAIRIVDSLETLEGEEKWKQAIKGNGVKLIHLLNY